jgi:hypothetical protein
LRPWRCGAGGRRFRRGVGLFAALVEQLRDLGLPPSALAPIRLRHLLGRLLQLGLPAGIVVLEVDRRQFLTTMSPDVIKRIKHAALADDRNAEEIMEEAAVQWLERQDAEETKNS